jgi:hypothetical protein
MSIYVEVIGASDIYVLPETGAPRIYVEVKGIIYQNTTGDGGTSGPLIRLPLLKQSSYTALATDATKFIKLDGSINEVDYSVNPALFTGLQWPVYCVTAQPNPVRIIAINGGVINNGDDTVEMFDNDQVLIYSDGTDLFIR